jgi:hypothetical protein
MTASSTSIPGAVKFTASELLNMLALARKGLQKTSQNGIYITNNMRNMFPPVYSNLRNFFRCCQARKAVVSERSPENDLTNFLTCGHSSHISGGPYCWTLTMLSSWIQRPPKSLYKPWQPWFVCLLIRKCHEKKGKISFNKKLQLHVSRLYKHHPNVIIILVIPILPNHP